MNTASAPNCLVILLIVCLFIACSDNRNGHIVSGSTENIKINIDKVSQNDTVYFSDLFNDYHIIPLETRKECLIGQINSIRFCDSKIIILDGRISKSVFIFDLNGNFIRKIGKVGKGPGEYISPSSISADEEKKEIAIYDGRLNRIQLFSLEGKFLKSIKIRQKLACKSIEVFNGRIYLSNYVHNSIKYLLFSIDLNGKVIGEWLPNDYKFHDNSSTSRSTIFFRTPQCLRFRNHLMNTIFDIRNSFARPFISLESKDHMPLKELEELYEREGKKNRSNFLNEKFIGISSYSEGNNLSIVEYSKNAKSYTLFYDQETGKVKNVKFLNFKDDMTHFSGRQAGYFFTSYKDNLVALVAPFFMKNFLENVKYGKISSNNHNLGNLTVNSNPVIIIYQWREKPIL